MYPGRPTGKGELQSPYRIQEDLHKSPGVYSNSDVTDKPESISLIYFTVWAHCFLRVAHTLKVGHACQSICASLMPIC